MKPKRYTVHGTGATPLFSLGKQFDSAASERLRILIHNSQRKHKHHQWLTYDFGQPELYTHLVGAIAIMNTVVISDPKRAWPEFRRRLQRWRPKINTTLELSYDDEE